MFKLKSGGLFFFYLSLMILTLFLPPILVHVGGSGLTIYIGEIFLFLATSLWILSVIRKKHITLNIFGKYSFWLAVFGFLSIINADNIKRFFIGEITYIEVILIVFLFSDIALKEKYQKKLINYFTYAACILSLFIIYTTVFQNGGQFIIGNKINLSIGGSNYLATMLLIPFFINLTAIFRNKISLSSLIKFALMAVSIIFTASRAALIIAGCLSVLYILSDLVFSRKIRLGKKVFSLILLLIGGTVVYYVGKGFINEMIMEGRFNNLSQQTNLLSRYQIFDNYISDFLKHPILGNGYLNVVGTGTQQDFMAHNFILQILGDNGIITCLIFVGLLFSVYRFVSKKAKSVTDQSLKSFILGYKRGYLAVLIHGMLEPNFGTRLFMLYVFIGLGIIISSTSKESQQLKEQMKNVEKAA